MVSIGKMGDFMKMYLLGQFTYLVLHQLIYYNIQKKNKEK